MQMHHKNMDFRDFRIWGEILDGFIFRPRQCSMFICIVFVAFTSISFHFIFTAYFRMTLYTRVPIY